jgi:hypothetical protein
LPPHDAAVLLSREQRVYLLDPMLAAVSPKLVQQGEQAAGPGISWALCFFEAGLERSERGAMSVESGMGAPASEAACGEPHDGRERKASPAAAPEPRLVGENPCSLQTGGNQFTLGGSEQA